MVKSSVTVLLNGWGGFGGTGIVDCLRNNYEGRRIKIVCADMSCKPALEYKADSFHILPRGNSREYITKLLKLCQEEDVEVILPGSNLEIINISRNISRITSAGVHVALDDYERMQPLLSKAKTYEILKNNGVDVPAFVHVKNTSQLVDAVKQIGYPQYPVCFKPSSYTASGGARGFRILRRSSTTFDIAFGLTNEIDYESLLRISRTRRRLDMLVMEYLPGQEFSTYVFSDAGKMMYCVPNIRERMIQQYSFDASTVNVEPRIAALCRNIVRIFGLSYNTNIQLKISRTGRLKVVELNPRMGGSIVLPMAAGINLPYLAVKMALGETIPAKMQYRQVRMVRYIRELFTDKNGSFEISQEPRPRRTDSQRQEPSA